MQAIYAKIVANKTEIANFFKWLSLPLILFALYYQLFIKTDFEQAREVFFHRLNFRSLPYLLLCMALMPVNLGTETLKWHRLIRKFYPIRFIKSYKSVITGIALSIFTPKRLGEYGGRVLLLQKHRPDAVGALFVSNLSQSIANLIIGVLSILLFTILFTKEVEHLHLITGIAIAFIITLTIIYFSFPMLSKHLIKWKIFRSKFVSFQQIKKNSTSDLVWLLCLSVLKYCIFILQFVLIIKAFGIQIDIFSGIICASCVFFIKTMLPVPASVELAARGSIAIFFFSVLTNNHIGILVASVLLWVVNLAIPALVGSLLIVNTKM